MRGLFSNHIYFILLFSVFDRQCTCKKLKNMLSQDKSEFTLKEGRVNSEEDIQSLRKTLLTDILRRLKEDSNPFSKTDNVTQKYRLSERYSNQAEKHSYEANKMGSEPDSAGPHESEEQFSIQDSTKAQLRSLLVRQATKDLSRGTQTSVPELEEPKQTDISDKSEPFDEKKLRMDRKKKKVLIRGPYKNQGMSKYQNTKTSQGNSITDMRPYSTGNDLTRPNFDNHQFIFGQDDRGRIGPGKMRKYPYKNIVKLSNGCTGTLVSPKHILTAAHCFHNGHFFKDNPLSLRVEVPHSMGTRIYYGKAVKIPIKWHKMSHFSNIHRAMYDYGIVELRREIPGHRRFMKFDWKSDTWKKPIKFIAYPYDDLPYMLQSTCRIDLKAGTLLLNRCDSSSGSSGAAAIMRLGKFGDRIVGVVSAVISDRIPERHFNAITRLTLHKIWDICDMIGPKYGRYVCSSYELQNRPRWYRRILVHGR